MSGVQKFPDSYISNYNMEFTVEQELIFTIKTYLDSEEVKLEKIKKLFKMEDKPDINFQNEYKQTPLHLAVQKKELKVIELLLNHGANINIKNDQNMSPLDAAKLLNNTDIVNLLQSHIEQSYHQSMKEQNQPQINVTCISHQNMDSTHSVTNFEIQGCSDSNAIKKQKKQVPSIHGFIYQLKLLVLFLYQGVNQELSFRLGTEIEEAQKFDDLMFEYSEDGKKKYRLLQAKHRLDESKKITANELLSDKDTDYSLIKYFFSYNDCKKNEFFTNGSIKDVIIFTNIGLDVESLKKAQISVQELQDEDNILNVKYCEKMSTRYRFNKNVCDLLKPKILNYNLTKLARKLAEFILKKNCIPHFQHPFELYHTALAEEVIDVKTKKFHEKFIKNENISEDAQKFRKAFRDEMNKQSHGKFKLENMDNLQITLELSRNFGQGEHKDWPSNTITDDDIQDFLDHLVLAVNQPNEDELGKLIEKEIGKEFDAIKSETLFNKLFMTMLTWIQDRDRSEFFSYEEGKQLLEEATRGFPVWFDVSPPAENFIGRLNIIEKLHQILLEAGSRAISQRICISGLGGIGKSELVRKYIHTYRASFDEKIVWINAESYKTLVESFCRLTQDKLRIPIIKDDKRINMKSIIEKVYNYFSDGKSLFIFDNAMKLRSQEEDDEGIDKFLPSSSPHVKNPYIIITSRNQRWGDLKTIVLESFTLEEAAEFIEKALNIKDGSQVTEIQDLNKKLQYFPLALQQAVAYIKERNRVLKNFDSVFTINNYILEYDEKTKKLLNFKFPEDSDNKYTKTTYTTWKVSTDIIKTNKKCGFKAMQILNMIAYTASSNISVKIFLKFKNRETLEEAIQLLKQYSLINSEERETLVRVHELVQQVIRIDLKEAKREKDVIKKILGLLSNTLLQNSFRYNVDHALSVWNYASKYEELVRKFSRVPAVIVKKLSILLRYQNACTFGKNAMKLLEMNLGDDHRSTQMIMENLASVLTCLGQDDDALNIYLTLEGKFKRRKQTPQFLKYNMEIAYIKIRQGDLDEAYMRINEQTTLVGLFGQINHSMGTLLLKQGSYDDALKMFKTDLRQKNTIFGSNHTSTLNTKNSIAFLFKMQGKYEEALKISRNVYKERKKRLGKEHPDTLETHYNTALYLYKLGKYNSALKIAYSVDKDREKMIPGHPCLIQGKLLIVEILKDQGKYQEAMKMCDEVYEQSSKVLGEAHPKTLECYAQMANLKELILLEQNIDSS